MTVRVTDSARSQLRAAVGALARGNGGRAARFVREVEMFLANRAAIEEAATPVAEFSGLPVSEIVVHGYRLFFRTANGTLWLSGVWRAADTV
jgi:plasmid stabilization system protein ParE